MRSAEHDGKRCEADAGAGHSDRSWKVVDNEPLQEKIKKICETYKDYRLRIEVGEQEELTGW